MSTIINTTNGLLHLHIPQVQAVDRILGAPLEPHDEDDSLAVGGGGVAGKGDAPTHVSQHLNCIYWRKNTFFIIMVFSWKHEGKHENAMFVYCFDSDGGIILVMILGQTKSLNIISLQQLTIERRNKIVLTLQVQVISKWRMKFLACLFVWKFFEKGWLLFIQMLIYGCGFWM